MRNNHGTSATSLFERLQEIGERYKDDELKEANLPKNTTELYSDHAIKHITTLEDEKIKKIIQEMFEDFPYGKSISAKLTRFSENPKALEEMLLVNINALLNAGNDENFFPGFLASFSKAFFQPSLTELIKSVERWPDFHMQWLKYKSALFNVAYYTGRGHLVESTAQILLSNLNDAESISKFISKIAESAIQVTYSVMVHGKTRTFFVYTSDYSQAQRQGIDRTIYRALSFLKNASYPARKDIGIAIKHLKPMALYNVIKVLYNYQEDAILSQVVREIKEASQKKWRPSHKVTEICHSYLTSTI